MRGSFRFTHLLVVFTVLMVFSSQGMGCKQTPPSDPAEVSNERGNSIGNLVNGGFTAQDQGWIYYMSMNPKGIYKIQESGTKKKRVCKDVANNINIVADWVYYINIEDNSRIYKVKTNGSKRQKLSDDKAWSLNVLGDWMYYCNTGENFAIYKMKTDGTNRQLLSSDDPFFVIAEQDWLYFGLIQENSKVYRIQSTDGSDRKAFNSLVSPIFILQDTWVYFLKYNFTKADNQLYKMKMDGSQEQLLHENLISTINVSGDWIYYINKSDQSRLYRIKTDGSENQKLYDEPFCSFPNVVQDWVYFMVENKAGQLFRIHTDGTGYEVVVSQ